MNEEKECLLCSGLAKPVFKNMNGYVEGTYYDVYECTNCLTSFIDLKKDLSDEYNIIYGSDPTKDAGYSYYLNLAKASKQLSNPLRDFGDFSAIFWSVVKVLKDKHIKKGAKILEIGSGLGYFTHSLNKAGYVCEGLEYSDTAVEFAKKFFKEKHTKGTIESISDIHKEFYDVVIATEVIEHLVDPVSFVENSLKVLKRGGKLIITTPIKDIHPTGTIWETEPAPIHLWWFTERGIEELGKKFNVKVSFVDFTEYTKNKVWSVHIGRPNVKPSGVPVVTQDRKFINPRKKSYKEFIMQIIPAWMYIKLVIFYHKLRFLQKDKKVTRFMYGMCAIIKKN